MVLTPNWKVLPHGPITPLEDNLWTVTGAFDIPFNPLKRVMTIARRDDGKLVLHGLVALDEKTQSEVEGLGEVAHLVVPSGFHRLDARRYRERYPNAKMYTPSGARARVEKVAKMDATYEEYAPDGSTALVDVDGLGKREGALVVKSKRGVTYVMNDALFNMPHAPGLSGFVLKHVTQSTGGPKVSRTARIAIVTDRVRYRAALEAIANTSDLVRVIVAHHVPVEGDVAAALRQAAADL